MLNNDDLAEREIILDEGRRLIVKVRELNITVIEILEEDDIRDFLDLYLNINKEEKYLESKGSEGSLFCLESKDGIDIKVSHGLFSENNKLIYIPPKPNNDNNYKGWPILSSNNFKVIGIHCGYCQSSEFAKGSFIRFINKSQNFENNIEIKKIKKIKNNEINNEITIKYIILMQKQLMKD